VTETIITIGQLPPAIAPQPTDTMAAWQAGQTPSTRQMTLAQAFAAAGAVKIGATPPSNPYGGQLWFDNVGTQLYVYYTDPNSSEWVIANNSGMTGAYLPLGGGTVTGGLNVAGVLYAGQHITTPTLYIQGPGTATDWWFSVAPNGSKIQQFQSATPNAWYDYWDATNGTRSWYGPSGVLMYLTGAGNLWVDSSVTTGTVNATTINAPTINTTSQLTAPYIVSTGAIAASDTVSGDKLYAADFISAAGLIAAGSEVYAYGDSSFGILQTGSTRSFSFSASNYISMDLTTDIGYWAFANNAMWYWNGQSGTCYNVISWTGGNGPYTNVSDPRLKQSIVPAREGLDVLQRLTPIGFMRAGRGNIGREIGFDADELARVLPEAVTTMPMPDLPDAKAIQESMILAVAVNAIKELKTELDALKRQLEGR